MPRRHRRRLIVGVVGGVASVAAALTVAGTLYYGRSGDAPRDTCRATPAQCAAWRTSPPDAAISRAEVGLRAHEWLDNHDVDYSMTTGHAGAGGWGWFRRDCSGFVSMALHLSDDNGGASTVSLAEHVSAIPAARLARYDLIGRLGPGTGGEHGHVQFFLGWANARHTRVRVAEQGGLTDVAPYPHVATYSWPETMRDGSRLQTYRYDRIVG